MSKKVKQDSGHLIDYPIFTKEMKKDYTILFPNMTQIHFELLKKVINQAGYRAELLLNEGQAVVDTGLKYVHNDTCYPALLVIGQMIDALQSGKYDLNKVALLITQTGGGCRASNYIFLLRKALQKAGLGHIPVLSLNFSGLEKQSSLKLTLPIIRKAVPVLAYGDMLMLLYNQVRSYEISKGESKALVDTWVEYLSDQLAHGKGCSKREVAKNFDAIVKDFAAVPVNRVKKVKVGVVGEIYVKYAPLANNHLEEFLVEQDCEVMVPGLLTFCLYCVQNMIEDYNRYGGKRLHLFVADIVKKYFYGIEKMMIDAVNTVPEFVAPMPFEKLMTMVDGIIDRGCKMGEGWVLTAEMVELTKHGYENIICAQPFGCLPNHIVAKGMQRKVKRFYPSANIVPIDYDPGATKVNQENRIKLMLSVAKERLYEEEKAEIKSAGN